jgi:membrane protein YdbS with pleckstrin-like domain
MPERPLTTQERNRALKVYLKDETWFRVLKIIYISVWILLSLFVAVVTLWQENDYWMLILGNVIIWMVFSVIDLAFCFYMRRFYHPSEPSP